jgi:hypothetical protein
MAITGSEKFTYLGYTEGDKGFPTLYFSEGRFTQRHKTIENIGWHPRKKGTYRAANISRVKANDLADIRKLKSDLKKKIKELKKNNEDYSKELKLLKNERLKINAFCTDFMLGRFDSSASDAKYFECYDRQDGSYGFHPSRSRLMKQGDTGFNSTYNEKYAKGILGKKESALAENEKNVALEII